MYFFSKYVLFTARVLSTTGGYVFTSVCLLTRGRRYPSPRFFQVSGPRPFPRESTPASGPMSLLEGVPQSWLGGTQDRTWVPPPQQDRTRVPPPPPGRTGLGYTPRPGMGYPPPGLVTPRAVCLLQFPLGGLSCFKKEWHSVRKKMSYFLICGRNMGVISFKFSYVVLNYKNSASVCLTKFLPECLWI